VTKYRSKRFTMAYATVGNENDAWDLAQEGFLRAWQSIHRFEGRSSFYTWLRRITMNLAIDLLRRQSRRNEVELDDTSLSFLSAPTSTMNALRFGSRSTRRLHNFLQNIALLSF
jgi:RNA polymerase sigma factor (sigma-70 family)